MADLKITISAKGEPRIRGEYAGTEENLPGALAEATSKFIENKLDGKVPNRLTITVTKPTKPRVINLREER